MQCVLGSLSMNERLPSQLRREQSLRNLGMTRSGPALLLLALGLE